MGTEKLKCQRKLEKKSAFYEMLSKQVLWEF